MTTQERRLAPPVPFDPECAAILPEYFAMVPRPLTADKILEMREIDVVPRLTTEELSRDGVFSVEERPVPGPEGAPDISLLICRPTAGTAPVPGVYWIHGGGMILGHNRVGLPEMLDFAQQLQFVVVSVEYRLAPENPHPAPVEDCFAGLAWVAEHAAEIGVDPERLVVAGVSGGGCLAAATALLARDRGGPALIGQFLSTPMLDDRNETLSSYQMDEGATWDRTANLTAWTAVLGEARGGPDVSPYAAPARATDLSGLPPAFLDAGSAEIFRDEIVAYANAIWAVGGQAELHVWPGAYHGHFVMAPHTRLSQATLAAQGDWLRRLLAQ